MKRIISLLLSFCIILSISACGKDAPTWQEQYDLGLRYLSEGNYKEAILAFEAAIEIDPRQENAYLSLAEVYTAQGDTDKASEILARAVEAIGITDALTAALDALAPQPEPEPTPEVDQSRTERRDLGDGRYSITEYNRAGQIVSQALYDADGSVSSRFTREYDSSGNQIRVTNYAYDGSYSVSEYDSEGTNTKQTWYFADGSIDYIYTPEYDDTGKLARNIWYYADGTVKEISEFNADGQEIRRTAYNPDGTISSVTEF